MKGNYIKFSLFFAVAIFLSSCDGGGWDQSIPPATGSEPKETLYLNFGIHALHDTVTNRYDPCRYFDGITSDAVQVNVRILVPDPNYALGLKDLYPVQIFRNGQDFSNGNPNGLGIQAPQSGGYVMIVTIYGEPNPDCCPGPPVGRPYYQTVWPYGQTKGTIRIRYMLPAFVACLYF